MKNYIVYIAVLLTLLIIPKLTLAETLEVETTPDGVGWVTAVEGRAKIASDAGDSSGVLTIGTEVFLGDEISTSINGRATIELNDGSVIALASLSRIKISSFTYNEETKKNSSYLKLFAGSVRGLLRNLFGNSSKMSFETKTSVVGVKGSDISVWLEGDETVVAVNEGTGFIKSRDEKFPGSARVKAGFMARGRGGVAVKRAFAIPDDLKAKINKLKPKRKKSLVNKFRKNKERELKKLREKGLRKIDKKSKKRLKKDIKSGRKPVFNR